MALEEQPRPISPATALELRLRFLEQVLAPPPPSNGAPSPPARVPLTRHVAALQEQLRTIVDKRANGSDAIKHFVANCEAPQSPLTPWAFFADAKFAAQTTPTPLYSLSAPSRTNPTWRA